jgi:tRNA nucleotidyltransferase/poly(A) polymerase
MIRELSGERIWQEFQKILISKRAIQALPVLSVIGLLDEILPEHENYGKFLKYVKREKKLSIKNSIGRLSMLLPRDEKKIKEMSSRLKLSNKQRDQLLRFADDYNKHDLRAKTLRRMIYLYGKDVVIHNLVRFGDIDEKTYLYISDYQIPDLPYSGKDLIAEGWKAGPNMGAELKRREQEWINADFTVTRH